MMQARWGSHGHYEIIALVPWSVQECFDLTVRAFNLAEHYRTPVLIMADAEIGHLTERLVIPPPRRIEVWNRKRPGTPPGAERTTRGTTNSSRLWASRAGIQGLRREPHPRRAGLRQPHACCPAEDSSGASPRQDPPQRHQISDMEERGVDGADVVILAYGISARVALQAMEVSPSGAASGGAPSPQDRLAVPRRTGACASCPARFAGTSSRRSTSDRSSTRSSGAPSTAAA